MNRTMALLMCLALLTAGCSPRAAATPPPVYETGVDPESWVKVPAGDFLQGIHEARTPMASGYEIMVTDVTNGQYARYLNAALAAGKVKVVGDNVVGYYAGDAFHGVRHEERIDAGDWVHVPINNADLRLTYDGKSFGVKPGYQNHPMTVVTWFGAKAYCEFNGGRLPTEAEWEKAARGTDARPYPSGNELVKNAANYYASGDPFEKGTGSLGDTTPAGFNNGKTYDGYQTLNAPSAYGAYDIAGNVWQWTADIYEGQHYRYMRGGSKSDYGYDLRVWTLNNARPDYFSPNVGFRCVR